MKDLIKPDTKTQIQKPSMTAAGIATQALPGAAALASTLQIPATIAAVAAAGVTGPAILAIAAAITACSAVGAFFATKGAIEMTKKFAEQANQNQTESAPSIEPLKSASPVVEKIQESALPLVASRESDPQKISQRVTPPPSPRSTNSERSNSGQSLGR